MKTSSSEAVAKGTGLVLMALCVAQFIMILDSAVMNVSIATVAADLGTTVTCIQTAMAFVALVALFLSERIPVKAVDVPLVVPQLAV